MQAPRDLGAKRYASNSREKDPLRGKREKRNLTRGFGARIGRRKRRKKRQGPPNGGIHRVVFLYCCSTLNRFDCLCPPQKNLQPIHPPLPSLPAHCREAPYGELLVCRSGFGVRGPECRPGRGPSDQKHSQRLRTAAPHGRHQGPWARGTDT